MFKILKVFILLLLLPFAISSSFAEDMILKEGQAKNITSGQKSIRYLYLTQILQITKSLMVKKLFYMLKNQEIPTLRFMAQKVRF